MNVIYITGYKPFEFGIYKNDHEGVKYIKRAIKLRLLPFIEEGAEWVIISGQLGVELWAAEVAIELKNEHEQVKLGVLTPFLNQEESWNEGNQEYYQRILSQADFVDSISKKPYEGPQQLRTKNFFMVHKSDGMIIVYDQEREGTPKYAFSEAKKYQDESPYPMIQISLEDLQQAAEEETWND
ncbi:DUF1273 domain-containing protein [Peribacillus cavernae]|uniref:UPF0398 protein ELQ35_10315 n=1 Tax=Peribacillus cavernae TaxID=1674310 RepID=A0A3S0VJT2_9BACI|nr:DUF1273 domain-containing protein [Peribacillus cavernae]MDQ0218940.1 putative phage-like protein YoqJ [Peribacillus cavernae]RUQ29349.1 DUF1273 domain-containing protein [Peribacillus cavernae]